MLPEHAAPDTTERIFLIGIGGPTDDGRPVVNGSPTPVPVELSAGVAHRFRFINISPIESHTVQLMSGDTIQQWRAVAKDGADLPTRQAVLKSGVVALHPGETYDFEVVRQHPETLMVRISSPETTANREAALARGLTGAAIPRIVTRIPIIVR